MRSIGPDNRTRRALLRARLASAVAAGRARLRSQRGSMLIEVMVGAVVLAIASMAILNGIDGAQSTGATNKVRSVQATLAQQDIERMRSIPISVLSNLRQTRTVAVAGVNYTVVSRTDWVSDRSGLVSCADDRAQAEYLKLSSTVTSPASTQRPVTETGLLTPTVGQLSDTSGSATVRLTNRDDVPLEGVTVTLSGSSSQSATTNALGCAVFGYIPSGTYTAAVNGYAQIDSLVPATEELMVYPGRASFGQMQVDRPATVRANFLPPVNQTNTTSMVWDSITVKNGNLPGGIKTFTRASPATSVDAAGLYPYTDGIGVYAGDCIFNDPSRYYDNATRNYFVPGALRGFTLLSPGDPLRAVNVEMPTMRVRVTREAVSGVRPAWFRTQLRVTALDSGCTVTVNIQPADRSTSLNTQVVFDMALPFGRYRLCAATRGRTSGTSGTTGETIIDRRYTTSATAGSGPANPTDQALTTVPAVANYAVPIPITTPSASSAAGMCF